MVNDASIKPHDTLPNEYILKRLLPIHPKKALNERTQITMIAKENRPLEINNVGKVGSRFEFFREIFIHQLVP